MSEVSSLIELHDSDIVLIEKVLEVLGRRQRTAVPLEGFRREIIERFEGIGLKVVVKVWDTNADGVFWFDVEIEDRLEGEFDPDRQVHEVTNDLLGLGDGGVIKTSPLWTPPGHTHSDKGHGH